MCLPAAAAGFGLTAGQMFGIQTALSALTIGTQFIGQQQQAKAIYEHQERQGALQRQIAADAARDQYMGMLKRQSQVREAAAQDVQDALGKTVRASASARVAAAAGGVTGGVVEEASENLGRQFEDWAAKRMTNLSWEEDQIMASMKGIEAQQKGRVAASIGDPVSMPSPLLSLAQFGASMFDAASFWGTQGQNWPGGR